MKVGAGRRSRADRVDDDDRSRRLAEPVLVLVRGGGGRVRAPDDDARRIPSRTRIEAELGGSVDVAERDVAGVVADRVRLDLGGAEPVEESLRERVREQAERAGVVGVQDGRPALRVDDALEALGDLLERRLPRDRREAAFTLRAGATERPDEASLGVEPLGVVAERALAAELAAADRMVRVAAHDEPVAAALDQDSAAVVAVARAGRAHGAVDGHGPDLRRLLPRRAQRRARALEEGGVASGRLLRSRFPWQGRSTSESARGRSSTRRASTPTSAAPSCRPACGRRCRRRTSTPSR